MQIGIICADMAQFEAVKFITQRTINEIYPHYYPNGAVAFFIAHHSDANISKDIQSGCVFLILDQNHCPVGTVTINGNEINRLFVLPEYQGQGYGSSLMDFAEKQISVQHDRIDLAASLPAKRMYLKRGYKEAGSFVIRTENGDFLCYDEMQKIVSV